MKKVLVIRHGELKNPRGIVYNRDSVMQDEDIIHLSAYGQAQFVALATEISLRGLVPYILWTSPAVRAQESAQILQQRLGITPVNIEPDLDDTYAPGPYIEQLTMTEWEQLNGNAYDEERWGKYGHETTTALTERMVGVMARMVAKLSDGQVGAMVSHGDPIAFLLNYLKDGVIPDPASIRNMLYPPKGSATLLTYSDAGEYISQLPFDGASLRSGNTY